MSQLGLFFNEEIGRKWPRAKISDDLRYRYFLSRVWDESLPSIAFIGLNPSTADAESDDPTIRRCIGFAKSCGGGSLWMINLFGYRATDPSELLRVQDPIGPENDQWIDLAVAEAHLVIAAWGNRGDLLSRAATIRGRHSTKLCALDITKAGMPKHPLYVRANVTPRPL